MPPPCSPSPHPRPKPPRCRGVSPPAPTRAPRRRAAELAPPVLKIGFSVENSAAALLPPPSLRDLRAELLDLLSDSGRSSRSPTRHPRFCPPLLTSHQSPLLLMSPTAGVLAGGQERTGCEGQVQYVLQEATPKAHRQGLQRPDTHQSILRQTNFKGANLLGASFFDTDLTGRRRATEAEPACVVGPGRGLVPPSVRKRTGAGVRLIVSSPPRYLHRRQHRMGSKWPVQKEDIRTRKRNHEDWKCGFLLPVVVIHHGPHGSQDQSLKKPSRDKGESAWDLLNSHQLVPRFR